MSTNEKRSRFLTTAGQKLRDTAMDAAYEAAANFVESLELSRAAAQSSVTSSVLSALALDYDNATTDEDRAELGAHIADSIPLAEAGTIRRAAEAIKLATPGIICRATADGITPNEIARQLGTGGSYVRRILRENSTLLAEAVQTRAAEKQPAPCCVTSAVPRIPHPELNGLTLPQGHALDCPARATD